MNPLIKTSPTFFSFRIDFNISVVSGVVALMLEANPNLGWRDVQDILARTAQPVLDDPENKSLQVNGAGLAHSNWYGFGIVSKYILLQWKGHDKPYDIQCL